MDSIKIALASNDLNDQTLGAAQLVEMRNLENQLKSLRSEEIKIKKLKDLYGNIEVELFNLQNGNDQEGHLDFDRFKKLGFDIEKLNSSVFDNNSDILKSFYNQTKISQEMAKRHKQIRNIEFASGIVTLIPFYGDLFELGEIGALQQPKR